MNLIQGLGVALITPFNEDRSIDYLSLEKLVEYNIKNGVDYLVVLGTTAENATLSKSEKEKVIDCIKNCNQNRVPLILGLGGNNTQELIEQLEENTICSGFEAILSVAPYYNKPNQEGIYQHYKMLAENSPLPIILYNVPGRTGINIEPETTLKLAKKFSNIIAIKEASPHFIQSTNLIKNKDKKFQVISGDDELALPIILAGGGGVISVIGQAFPDLFSQMIKLALERKVNEAYQIYYQLYNLFHLLFAEGNPTGIKSLLSIQGLCKPYTRLPLVSATDELKQKIEKEVKQIY